MDTVYALSTAQGKAGVAVIRVSGPMAPEACRLLSGGVPEERRASLRVLRDDAGERLDQALVLHFGVGESFTGESTVEFHLHGSVAVVSAVLSVLGRMHGLRLAEPGEFTRRALENGQLDLAQVEGLADLIEAETEAQRKQALRVFSGALGSKCETWRKQLIRAVALLEATIDFVDDEVPVDVSPEVTELILIVVKGLEAEISGVTVSERIRTGFEVAIVGAPNVGKSTLLNALAGREAAITSEYAGTTRDVIEVRMDLAGLPVTLLDTAGLRDTSDAVETIGIERARARAAQADLRVFLIEDLDSLEFDPKPDDIVVWAKADINGDRVGAVSGKTGAGLSELVDQIASILRLRAMGAGVATRERHRQAMGRGLEALKVTLQMLPLGEAVAEISAEELRVAIRALDSLVGRIDVETVLDEIFASFCLGK